MGNIYHTIRLQKASRIKLVSLDVDGVLTPGDITYTSGGEQIQSFSVKDGFGIKQLLEAGIKVVVVSSRSSIPLKKRAEELKITKVFQGVLDKARILDDIVSEFGVAAEEIAYIGDDWVDLPILKKVGLSVAVADAAPPLSDHVHMVTAYPGGKGAVREVCDLIMRAQNLWGDTLNRYLDRQ